MEARAGFHFRGTDTQSSSLRLTLTPLLCASLLAPFGTNSYPVSLQDNMKIFYIGVSMGNHRQGRKPLMPVQILKNESKPAHELCVEKDLSSYSRFTRDKYDKNDARPPSLDADELLAPQLWPVHVAIFQDSR